MRRVAPTASGDSRSRRARTGAPARARAALTPAARKQGTLARHVRSADDEDARADAQRTGRCGRSAPAAAAGAPAPPPRRRRQSRDLRGTGRRGTRNCRRPGRYSASISPRAASQRPKSAPPRLPPAVQDCRHLRPARQNQRERDDAVQAVAARPSGARPRRETPPAAAPSRGACEALALQPQPAAGRARPGRRRAPPIGPRTAVERRRRATAKATCRARAISTGTDPVPKKQPADQGRHGQAEASASPSATSRRRL